MGAVILLGLVLSLDSLRVSLALGTQDLSSARRKQIALAFGICDGVAPLLGLVAGQSAREVIRTWTDYLGPILLGAYGLYMVGAAWLGKATEGNCDSRWVMFGIPLALSIDNLAAGVALGLMRFPVVLSALVIGAISGLMSYAGLVIGAKARLVMTSKIELLGGIALILCAFLVALDRT